MEDVEVVGWWRRTSTDVVFPQQSCSNCVATAPDGIDVDDAGIEEIAVVELTCWNNAKGSISKRLRIAVAVAVGTTKTTTKTTTTKQAPPVPLRVLTRWSVLPRVS